MIFVLKLEHIQEKPWPLQEKEELLQYFMFLKRGKNYSKFRGRYEDKGR